MCFKEVFRSIQLHFSNFTKKYILCTYWSAFTITTLYEQYAFNEIKQRLTRLVLLCRLRRPDIHSGISCHNLADQPPSQQINH
uniref:Bestrophin homolog n=1 Tax=Parascaris equorum TaxID=6256 RepID=A0A914RL23_PAREQ